MKLKICLGLLAVCCLTFAVQAELEGYKIYDLTPQNEYQRKLLEEMAASEEVEFLNHPKNLNTTARVMVSPGKLSSFLHHLASKSLSYRIVTKNVAKALALSRRQQLKFGGSRFESFQTFDQINAYLDELAAKYTMRVRLDIIGKTYEGRDLRTITITNGDRHPNKKLIWVDGGMHAREWISPAAALYVIHQLVEHFPDNRALLENHDWIVLPVVNPDGYIYSHEKKRLWRKTRRPSGGSCIGTDPNKNFEVQWGIVGASKNPCDNKYAGPTPFSEPETHAMKDEILGLKNRIKLYLTLHAFGNNILHPWAWSPYPPKGIFTLDEVANAGANAIKYTTGTQYNVGSYSTVSYATSGGSDDWAFSVAGIPVAIMMELPGVGVTGYDPAPQQILPVVSEAWVGIKAMADGVMSRFK